MESACDDASNESFSFVKFLFGAEVCTCFWTEVRFYLLSLGHVFCPLYLVYSNTVQYLKNVTLTPNSRDFGVLMSIDFMFLPPNVTVRIYFGQIFFFTQTQLSSIYRYIFPNICGTGKIVIFLKSAFNYLCSPTFSCLKFAFGTKKNTFLSADPRFHL